MACAKTFIQLIFLLSAFGLFWKISSSSDLDPHYWQLSFGKPVTQSSTEGNQVASLADDGNFKDDDSECAKTAISDNPYLELDLETDTFVQLVAFTFPGSQDSYTNLKIVISNSDNSKSYTAISPTKTLSNKIKTNPNLHIRYIRISREEPNVQLSVCEIAAYRMPVENLAMFKPVDASSDIIYKRAYRVVDLDSGSMVTTHSEQNPWLKIDLGDFYFVHDIFLLAVFGSNNAGPMLDINIRIGTDVNSKNNPLCTIEEVYVGEGKTIYCDMFGDIISIHRTSYAAISLSEVFVNTINSESVKAKQATSNTLSSSNKSPSRAIDLRTTHNWFTTNNDVQEKRLKIELDGEFHVVMIYIVGKNLGQFKLELGLTSAGSYTQCLPGLHDMYGKDGYYFFCVQRTLADYISIIQLDKKRTMEIGEVLIFDETKPGISYNKKYIKHVWAEEGKDATISCDLNGYPTPVWSWVKDKNVVAVGPRSMTLLHVKQNESATYECWANNTHGYNAMKVVLTVSSKWRICADHAEINYDLKTSAVKDFEIQGDQWYSSFDNKQMKHLQFRENVPKPTSSCQLWLNRKHPALQDGVVRGTLCLRNATHDCVATFDVDIRRCSAYYIYHFASLGNTAEYKFCFESAIMSMSAHHPSISSPVQNSALYDKILQSETEVAESYKCFIMCQVDPTCKSFNFSQKHKICELNTATRKEFPRNFGPRNHYSYYQMNSGIVTAARRRSEL